MGILVRLNLILGDGWPPHPGWFLAKSSETLEKKGVEFLLSAKEFAKV
jgi:hypothetical protein